jgi:hypothetical protein
MGSASWLVTAAGWIAIAAGAAVILLGVLLFGSFFLGRGSLSGMFAILSLGAGPLLTLTGVAVIVSGFKLMGGHSWTRMVLEIFSWIALCASIVWVIYSTSQHRDIHFEHVFEGAMFFLVTGVPAIVMILLLRSDAIQRALTR